MKKEIIKDPKAFLDRCDEVSLDNPKEAPLIEQTIQDLKDTLRANTDLVALSAPQIGAKMRLFCIRFKNGDIRAFLNPLVITRKGIHLSRENQIGMSSTEYIVPRSNEVQVAYTTPVNVHELNAFLGVVGEVFQQMLDLLDGTLLQMYGLEIIPEFDEASEEEKKAVIDFYLKDLSEKDKQLDEVIKNDPEVHDLAQAINFTTLYSLGKIETIEMTEEDKEKLRKAKETK